MPIHGAVETARVVRQTAYDDDQFILRLSAPQCAGRAEPGHFVQLTCAAIPTPWPLPILRADASAGWIEVLYKVVEPGLQTLAARKAGEAVTAQGPIGRSFEPHSERSRPLLIGDGMGMAPIIFLADRLRSRTDAQWRPLVLMGAEIPFPFRSRPSRIVVSGIPDGTIACMPLLDEWGVASRLASRRDSPGCYDGYVTQLAEKWLQGLNTDGLADVELFACGPTPMLQVAGELARRFAVPWQPCPLPSPEHRSLSN
jgi:dihydroorotate dehydrogenase electron transfer subunit